LHQFQDSTSSIFGKTENFKKENKSSQTAKTSTISQTSQKTPDDQLFASFCNLPDSDSDDQQETINTNKHKIILEREIFANLLKNSTFSESVSVKSYWIAHKKDMPNIANLAMLLYNIPSSSAFIERFFSICGVVNRTRAGNMSVLTLQTRAFLKSNIEILNELNN
jgi:hypothetical protein